MFHQFLADYRTNLLREHVQRYINHAEDPLLETESRAVAASVIEMIDLALEDIIEFYTAPATPNDSQWSNPMTAQIPAALFDESIDIKGDSQNETENTDK